MRYIEIVLIIDLVIHIVFIGITNYIMRTKRNYLLIVLSCIVDVLYSLGYILIPYQLEGYKYVLIYLISIIPFLAKGFTKALMCSLVYLLLNFTLGGSAEILYLTLNHYAVVIISLVGIVIIFSVIALFKKYKVNTKSLEYEICIKNDNRNLYLNGFCDTGNLLTTDENIPIVFLNKNIRLGKYKKTITIFSLATEKDIELYEVEEFRIKIKKKYIKKDVYLAYADISYNVMFGLSILGG